MPHEDGPKYEPVVSILSLGAPTVFRFYEKPNLSPGSECNTKTPALSLILPSKSLLVFRGKYYDQYLHGIEAVQEEIVDSSVANRHLFPRQSGSKGGALQSPADSSENDEGPGTQSRLEGDWSFPRGGTRVSLTMRNGFQKIACVQL
jgi:hypothetical protein